MAKLSALQKAQMVARANEIRGIRHRFAQALEMGYSSEEAAKLASGKEPLVPLISPTANETKANEIGQEPTKTSVAQVNLTPSESVKQNSISARVPPNWQDLPWPNLLNLANEVTRTPGKWIRSRREAIETIEDALANKD